ncbi:MAG: HlyD family efflux transporter periplasmic adaptor subunit [Candidatus Pristimantibacillus lignocellulolyticus]|uniref:HlyD family efflux transporter periplasmic adaptor subunit n=1 Tax=Candidatus Pristimantibacillus lignocellulolyticus TaxID=2994561 RepID=A0A9J6ZHL3_9BACL|nr:MAG: HlyD family efflux transporter periplasmic adaptor subunit [Candidatus Pristimantibacillus lignocellulolyticus]
MKAIIRNLSDMSDSRELLEARTSPAITSFLVILLVLIGSVITWSFFGQIDETAKAQGVVRPNEKVSTIQSSTLGQIEDIFVSEGMYVEEGDSLIVLQQEEYVTELNYRLEELEQQKQELVLLERYMQSIEIDQNLFQSNIEEESYYYKLVEQFNLEYQQLELDYMTADQQIKSTKTELEQSQSSIDLNIEANKTNMETTKQELSKAITQLTEDIKQEKNLKLSIQSGKNKISSTDELRTAQYEQYSTQLKQLQVDLTNAKNTYETSLKLGDRFISQVELEQQLGVYEKATLQVTMLEKEALLSTESNITSYETKLEELNLEYSKLIQPNGSLQLEIASLDLKKEQLNIQEQELKQKTELTETAEVTSLQKYRLDRVVIIQASIDDKQSNIESIQENIQKIEQELENKTMKSPVSGTVNIVKELNKGDVIQPGEPLLTILPTDETMYKASIAVTNQEIGKIAIGDQVKLNFDAFPKQSYGSLVGEVTSIGSDAVVQQDGLRYYIIEAAIANEPLVNQKGEQGEIRVGMTAEAYIVTNSQKIIYYILEKINLKE